MILDLGSGLRPWPDAFHVDISKNSPHLECVCDAHYLPFVSKTFVVSRLSHVLEHLCDPLLALEELKRVTSKAIVLTTPDAKRACVDEDPTHIYSWNARTFEKLLKTKFEKVHVTCRLGKSYSKIGTVKLLVLSVLSRHSELAAVCEIEPIDRSFNQVSANAKADSIEAFATS